MEVDFLESSEDDTPIEEEVLIVSHKEWVDKVMKDEMSFTVRVW